ncbi:DDE-type integrase/transposase/recombinase [Myxococcota bacterium]
MEENRNSRGGDKYYLREEDLGEEDRGPWTGRGDGGGDGNDGSGKRKWKRGNGQSRRGRRLVQKDQVQRTQATPEQRLMVLDVWKRSGLDAKDIAPLVGFSPFTIGSWKRRFEQEGIAGLMDKPRGRRRGSKLPTVTKRAILMLKDEHPEYGSQRISDELARWQGLSASESAVTRVLKEAGYEFQEVKTRAHRAPDRRFERSKPLSLWQTDLFTFTLKRQNRRAYLVAYLDDYSRFVVGHGLYGSSTTALVIEVLRGAIANYGAPKEILTDNGPQYATWRGKSRFTKELEKLGIKQVVARPKRPQTLGKVERMWGSLWREFLQEAVFRDLEEARERIKQWFDHYNFRRVHQGIGGLVPADRFFEAAPEVLEAMKQRVEENALQIAQHGRPPEPFYLTGQVGGRRISVHAKGRRLVLSEEGKGQQEVELGPAEEEERPSPQEEELAPGRSALDEALADLCAGWPEVVGTGGDHHNDDGCDRVDAGAQEPQDGGGDRFSGRSDESDPACRDQTGAEKGPKTPFGRPVAPLEDADGERAEPPRRTAQHLPADEGAKRAERENAASAEGNADE